MNENRVRLMKLLAQALFAIGIIALIFSEHSDTSHELKERTSSVGFLLFGTAIMISTSLLWKTKEPLRAARFGFTCQYEENPKSYKRAIIAGYVFSLISLGLGVCSLVPALHT